MLALTSHQNIPKCLTTKKLRGGKKEHYVEKDIRVFEMVDKWKHFLSCIQYILSALRQPK